MKVNHFNSILREIQAIIKTHIMIRVNNEIKKEGMSMANSFIIGVAFLLIMFVASGQGS